MGNEIGDVDRIPSILSRLFPLLALATCEGKQNRRPEPIVPVGDDRRIRRAMARRCQTAPDKCRSGLGGLKDGIALLILQFEHRRPIRKHPHMGTELRLRIEHLDRRGSIPIDQHADANLVVRVSEDL